MFSSASSPREALRRPSAASREGTIGGLYGAIVAPRQTVKPRGVWRISGGKPLFVANLSIFAARRLYFRDDGPIERALRHGECHAAELERAGPAGRSPRERIAIRSRGGCRRPHRVGRDGRRRSRSAPR